MQLIGLLRGVNLGARNRLGMADLRALVEGLGYENPRTLLQSGNVVFDSGDSADNAGRRLEEALRSELGLGVPVLIRTPKEMAAVVERNPLGKHATEPRRYQVVFLSRKPAAAVIREIDAASYAPEMFAAHGREIYVWTPDGVQAAKLGHGFWEKRLGVTATARNWNTVEKLLAMTRD